MKHTLSILVENRFGELSRIVGLFSARGLNIESLNVAETNESGLSRATLVAAGDDKNIERITRDLDKQVRVIEARNMTGQRCIEREMALISVATSGRQERQEALSLAAVFGGRVVDLFESGLIIEATGEVEKLGELIELLSPLGIRELARTGAVAITRPERCLAAAQQESITQQTEEA